MSKMPYPGAEQYKKQNKRRRAWQKVVSFLACIVVFCTTYALILPAITMERDAFCGIEEHTHSEECYEQVLVTQAPAISCSVFTNGENTLNGGNVSVAHTHDASCYDPTGTCICPLAERPLHTHVDACYAPAETQPPHTHEDGCYAIRRGELICRLEESEGHAHGDTCYVPGQTLTCTREETPGHTHSASCETKTLTCTLSTEPAHTHDPSCYQSKLICTQDEVAATSREEEVTETVLTCENTEEGHVHDADTCYQINTTTKTVDVPGHTHGDGCYESELACGQSDEAHVHGDACYESEITCGQEEYEGHTHGPACYEPVLNCEIPVSEGHTHGDDCYEQNKTLICEISEDTQPTEPEPVLTCGMQELILHTHSDLCTSGDAPCTQPEVVFHTHEESCFTTVEVPVDSAALTCTQPESEDHSHNFLCYGQWDLVCGLEEHIHEDSCYSDPTADVETAAQWEAAFAHIELTGDWNQDVLAIARTQLGYRESEKNFALWEDGSAHGYTRYGAWYGSPYGDWCAMFVSFCLHYAEVEGMPLNWGVRPWIEELTELELYHVAAEYTPQPGDLVFYDWEGDGLSDHVGLVAERIEATETEPAKLKAIEGNSANCVQYVTYDLNDPVLLGYSELPEPEETEPEETAYLCGLEAHTHTGDCYNETDVLICTIPEHTHTEACLVNLTDEQKALVDEVIAAIEAIPSADEIDAKIMEFEGTEDYEGEEAYLTAVYADVKQTYIMYSALDDELKALVTNADKLLELEYIWSAKTIDITEGIPVYQMNSYVIDGTTGGTVPTLFYGKSADAYGYTDMTFAYWSSIVVEQETDGRLRVSQIDTTSGTDKSAYAPSTSGGFVLLVWHDTISPADLDVSIGDIVSVPFDYTAVQNYTGTSYGTITFASADFKSDKNNASKLTTIQGANTRDFIELNLYDYNDSINTLWNSDKTYPGFQQDKGTTAASLSAYGMNFGNNITSDYDAGNTNVTIQEGSTINATISFGAYDTANVPISGAMYGSLIDGYPALADGTRLDYLFSNSAYATRQNSQSINHLFLHNSITGAYTFNSRTNHAQFNPGSDTFTLYNQLISSNFIMYPFGNFLPFNDIVHLSAQTSTIDRSYLQTIAASAQYKANGGYGDEYQTLATELYDFIDLMDAEYGTDWAAADAMNEYFSAAGIGDNMFSQTDALLDKVYSIDFDEPTDFYFGMEMKMRYMQPKGGLTGNDGKQPMIFYFTGDDDVWVYIDEILFLDLSGIHRHVGGEIDFVNGTVKYYGLSKKTGDVDTVPYKTVTFAEILGSTDKLNERGTFTDYSTHSFNFYYMERGAGSGVCRMNFNFPLLKRNSISVSKEVESSVEVLGDPDYKFQVLKAGSSGEKTNELFIGANTAYTIYDANDKVLGTGTTDANGIFTLKAGQRAEFKDINENAGKYYVRELLEGTILEQYGNVTVSGESTTTSNNITVGSDTFTGMDSPVKDMSDGATAFRFTNTVAEEKLGSLSISKQLTEYSTLLAEKTFDMEVTLDGRKLPVGTTYTVAGETRTVTTEGILTIAAGEKAELGKILAGTEFTVKESAESAAGYIVTYTTEDGYTVEQVSGGVKGVIRINADVRLIVNNREKGTVIEIPGTKALSVYDGTERTFEFELVEVTDATGAVLKDSNVSAYVESVKITGQSQPFTFRIAYAEVDMDTLPQTFCYRITEKPHGDTLANNTVYVVQVEVTEEEDGGPVAAVTSMWKGTMVEGIPTELTLCTTNSADFVNTLKDSLSLEKHVEGSSAGEGFTFEITLTDPDGTPITGQFPAEIVRQDSTDSELISIGFTDGRAVLESICDGDKITISDIPYGTIWRIMEVNAAGYKVTTTVTVGDASAPGSATETPGSAPETTGTVTVGGTSVVYTNTYLYELPETGGTGVHWYILGGVALMTVSLGFLTYITLARRRKEENPSP